MRLTGKLADKGELALAIWIEEIGASIRVVKTSALAGGRDSGSREGQPEPDHSEVHDG